MRRIKFSTRLAELVWGRVGEPPTWLEAELVEVWLVWGRLACSVQVSFNNIADSYMLYSCQGNPDTRNVLSWSFANILYRK